MHAVRMIRHKVGKQEDVWLNNNSSWVINHQSCYYRTPNGTGASVGLAIAIPAQQLILLQQTLSIACMQDSC